MSEASVRSAEGGRGAEWGKLSYRADGQRHVLIPWARRERVVAMHRLRYPRSIVVAAALGALTCFGALLPGAALASEPSRPTIESMSAGIGGEITVGAQINPEGFETTYEIKVECRGTGATCEPLSNAPRRTGMLPASFAGQEVSLNVTGLEPGTYWFSVFAQNALGPAYQRSNILDVPSPPPGACPTGCPSTGEQYGSEIPGWFVKEAEEQAAQTLAEYQAKQRQAAKEQEEQQARAAALRSVEEAALRQREAEAEQASEPPAHPEQKCVVPALKGLTLSAARRALSKAHCRLGRVTRPARHHSVLVVVEQGPRHGKRLPAQAAVSVKLLRAQHRSG